MARAVDYILRLANTSGGNEKKAILREAVVDGCSELFLGFQLAYDKMRVFGVKQVPFIEGNFTEDELLAPSDFGWNQFKGLARNLEARRITGNAARDALHAAAKIANIQEWNHFYRPILMKDMRCGVTETTINKILKEFGGDALKYTIKVWKVQLAEDAKGNQDRLVGQKYLDQKLDGVRLSAVLNKDLGTVRMFTRNGKENSNFSGIIAALEKLLPDLPISIVLDGEIVSKNFQMLMTQVNRKTDVDTSDAHYALFDMLALEDFEKGGTRMQQKDRQAGLVELQDKLREVSDGKIFVLPKLLVDLDTQEGKDKMRSFYDETIAAGYEGIMVKDPRAGYECKRAKHWLKWKPTMSLDLKIVGVEEGTKRNEGRLGALVCEGTEGNKFIRVNVGSGYSDSQRDSFWSNQNKLIGEIVEVECDSITHAQGGDHYGLRFPRFKRFRSIDRHGKI